MRDPVVPSTVEKLIQILRDTAEQPPSDPSTDNGPWDLWLRVSKAELEQTVMPAIYRLLRDPRPLIRRRAVDFSMSALAESTGALDTLMKVLEGNPELFGEDVVEGRTLRSRAEHALANWCEGSGRERDIARSLIKVGRDRLPDPSAAGVLARYDPDYLDSVLRAHLAESEAESVAAAAANDFAVYHRDRLIRFLTGIQSLSDAARELAAGAAIAGLRVPQGSVATLVRRAGIPEPKARPTESDVKAALNLP